MFLHVHHDSTTLSTGKFAKFVSHFCGAFLILKHIASSPYRPELPNGIKVHHVFHVCSIKELLGFDYN